MSAEIIIAISGLVAGVGGALMAWRAQTVSARRDAVILLREEVARLHERLRAQDEDIRALREGYNEALQEISRLRGENELLRAVLHQHGIEVPELRRSGDDENVKS